MTIYLLLYIKHIKNIEIRINEVEKGKRIKSFSEKVKYDV